MGARAQRGRVWLGRQRVNLGDATLLGVGGEAEVYALADGRALKLFKQPTHPDLQLFPAEAAAAVARLDEHQRKLPAFPRDLPPRVVAPDELATTRRGGGGDILGYAMRRIDGAEHLMSWSDPRRRRRSASLGAARVVELLLDLHASVEALHRCGVVIGDFNDLNVLVAGAAAYLIDADSFQFGAYRCAVFTQRFVDPLRCDAQASSPQLVRPHDLDSDWYAFTVMVMRSLLCVGPYGGVYRPSPSASSAPISHAARPLHRVTIFDERVLYPKPALPLHSLPDSVLDHLRAVFIDDRRGPFPASLLRELAFSRCARCGLEHGRAACPGCTVSVPAPARVETRGRVSVERLFEYTGRVRGVGLGADGRPRVIEGDHEGLWLTSAEGRRRLLEPGSLARAELRWARPWAEGALIWDGVGLRRAGEPGQEPVDFIAHEPAAACHGEHRAWISGGRLRSDATTIGGRTHTKELGRVLSGQSRIWLGPRFGLCLGRVGALLIPATFDPRRAGLSDVHRLPPLRGRIVRATACLSETTAWLFMLVQQGARLRSLVHVLDASGRVLGSAEASAEDPSQAWMGAGEGAAALASMLFVPTDSGLVRVELVGAQPRVTRTFPDTEPFVDAASELLVGARGLAVITGGGVFALRLD